MFDSRGPDFPGVWPFTHGVLGLAGMWEFGGAKEEGHTVNTKHPA